MWKKMSQVDELEAFFELAESTVAYIKHCKNNSRVCLSKVSVQRISAPCLGVIEEQ